jgi:hypothetical protein
MSAAEPLETQLCAFEVEIATEKMKSYKSPKINQIAAEWFQARCKIACIENHKFINSTRRNEKLLLRRTVSSTALI